jgi:hypothetical protein
MSGGVGGRDARKFSRAPWRDLSVDIPDGVAGIFNLPAKVAGRLGYLGFPTAAVSVSIKLEA